MEDYTVCLDYKWDTNVIPKSKIKRQRTPHAKQDKRDEATWRVK